ncbi:MAG: hypothetical protein Q4G09_03510 [Clostridia bacterium]|nr:hypothetical protein [Clostridia bacterium]
MDKSLKKELLLYSIIAIIVIVISILNSVFWKIGKNENNKEVPKNEIQYLEQDNITYNVPYEEQWLD